MARYDIVQFTSTEIVFVKWKATKVYLWIFFDKSNETH